MPPFVLHAETAASNAAATNAPKRICSTRFMAQSGYLWSMRASPAPVEGSAMPSQRAADAASIADARLAFRTAHVARAATLLQAIVRGSPGEPAALLLLARAELRRGDPSAAVAALAGARALRGSAKGEAAMLKAVAFARLGDDASSKAQFRIAAATLTENDPLRGELIYHQAAAEWMNRRLDRAERLLERISRPGISPDLDLHIRILRGAIASAGENLAEQGAIVLQAVREVPLDEVEVYLYAMLVTHIAALAVELPSTALRDAALAHVDRVPWTPDIADLHFHTTRAVAWRHALEGDEFNAFRRLKQALGAARSDAWRVAALADRAYLAAALGERRWAAQELRDAHDLAGAVDWNAVAGEEKLALPVLAELFATRDPAVAAGYVTTFKNLDKHFPRILSSSRDRRIEALEAYALGRVQFALGERAEAKRLLAASWRIYDELGIQWRAARAALSLAEIEPSKPWRERAASALRPYPRCWLTRRGAAGISAVEASSLPRAQITPAQQTVLELLLEGRGTDEIARELGRSAFTVRNHIKAIFKAFGVSSRAALVLRARP